MNRNKDKYTASGASTPEYNTWKNIKARCHNPKNKYYKWYGARDIFVCDEWKNDFGVFLSNMGRRPAPEYSIDRIDNNKGYSPDNCRWATRRQQSRNRSSSKVLEFSYMHKNQVDWASEFGLHKETLASRLKAGWSINDALTRPPRRKVPWHPTSFVGTEPKGE
jgi:hypothetical protein